MAIINSHGMPVCEPIPKTCARCGKEFSDYSDRGTIRICPDCKRPRLNPSRDLAAMRGQALTFREVQICNLVAAGKFNKQIAHQLHLGEGTIKTFMSIIMAKADVPNRTALAIWWIFKTNDTLTALAAAGMGPE
jgi:DNA-binding CsgD family transcriptional regulator